MKIALRSLSFLAALWAFWFLPHSLKAQGILPSQWTYGPITSAQALGYSTDGKLLAVGGDGGVQIWTVSPKSFVTCLPTQAGEVYSAAFSPDGHTLAIGGSVSPYGDGGPVIELWNVNTHKFIRSIFSQASIVYSVSFSADGKLLADGGWSPSKLEVWNVANGQQVASLPTGLNTVSCVKFAPTGAVLAAGGYTGTNGLEIWDTSNAKLLHSLKTAATEVNSVSFSPDGKSLVAGGFEFTTTQFNDGTAEVWDIASGNLNNSLQTGSTNVQCVAYSPDGRSIAVTSSPPLSATNTLGVWDSSSFKLVSTLESNPQGIAGVVAFSPDGKSLTAFGQLYIGYNYSDFYTAVVTWDLAKGNQTAGFSPAPYNSSSSVSFSPNGKSIALGGYQVNPSSVGGWIGLWNATAQKLQSSFNSSSTNSITSVSISPDGLYLADVSGTPRIGTVLEIWNIATGKLIASNPIYGPGGITTVEFSPVGDILAAGTGSSDVQIWNASTGKPLQTIVSSAGEGVNSLAFSPDGTEIVICGSMQLDGYQIGVLQLWDVSTGQLVSSLNTGLYSLNTVVFGHDGKMIADSGLRYVPSLNEVFPVVELWSSADVQSPTYLSFSDASNPIGTLAFTPDDKTLLAVVSQGIQAFDTASGDQLANFDIGPVSQISLSPKGDQLAYTLNSVLAVADIPSFGSSQIASVSFNPADVPGGTESTGTVNLARAAPAGGLEINLSTNSPAATVLPSITVPGGATKASFSISTLGVNNRTAVSITAEAGTKKKSATLTIEPPTLASIEMLDPSIAGGTYCLANVSLTGPAGPSGVVVSFKSSSSSASVPVAATIDGGQTSTIITINTSAVQSLTKATVTATLGSVSKSAILTITPSTLSKLIFNSYELPGGTPTTGTVYCDGLAPPNGLTVHLASSAVFVSVPSSVTIAAGTSLVQFTINTTPVAKNQAASVTASFGQVSKVSKLTVDRPELGTLTLNPSSLQGGQTSIGTITIQSPAPATGLAISLSTNNTFATVPATITIPSGKTSATFLIQTTAVPSTTGATIRATLGAKSVSTVLSIS